MDEENKNVRGRVIKFNAYGINLHNEYGNITCESHHTTCINKRFSSAKDVRQWAADNGYIMISEVL